MNIGQNCVSAVLLYVYMCFCKATFHQKCSNILNNTMYSLISFNSCHHFAIPVTPHPTPHSLFKNKNPRPITSLANSSKDISNPVVLNWAQFCPTGDMCQCLETILVVTAAGGGGRYWHVAERPGVLLHIL